MSTKLLTTFQADAEIRKARDWWETNRPAARHLLKQEMERAFERLKKQPESGKRYPDLRSVVLRKTQYLLFYKYDAAKDLVLVVSLRATKRKPKHRIKRKPGE